MRSSVLAFLLGILILQQFVYLPRIEWVGGIVLLAVIIRIIFKNKWLYIRLFIIAALGFAWALWFVHLQIAWVLPSELEGKNILISGVIASIPETAEFGEKFLFSLEKFNGQKAKGLVSLSWRDSESNLHVGDRWEFTVKLKKIHGTFNPGGFDYEAFALQKNIRAQGYIISSDINKLLNSNLYQHPLDRMRQYIKEKIEKNLPPSNTSPWIVALTVGERQGISAENWQVLRNTGTNHLMAIAGLHIGFMAGFAYGVICWLWRRIPRFPLYFPAQHAGSIAALLMALMYSAMAGFSIPTQRACIMLTVFLGISLCRRKIISWHAWSLALFIVLIINPLSVLTESFWLSFGSVALIIYGVSGRLAPSGWWWKWGRIQWVIAVGLIPLGIWLFQECSISSFVANSIAIPCIGFLIVPLCLFGSVVLLFSDTAGGFILEIADNILNFLWNILAWLSHLDWASWYHVVPNQWILLAACMGVVFLLLPAGFPGRWIGIVWVLPMIFYQPPMPKSGEVWLTLLDVGQGLSTVVQTEKHVLVFDTGARFSESFNMGENVVLPFLRLIGAKKIDLLVISHGDNDHIGGADAILKHMPVLEIKTSEPEKFSNNKISYCLRGESWDWDGVNFAFLYPPRDTLDLNNDSSCVLRITSKNQHVLLTGDIEKLAEKYLVANVFEYLPADILIAPHHGSKTSAVDNFVESVNPHYVLFPVGYRNRYHFPNKNVVEKYRELGAIQLDTANAGAIRFFGLDSKPELYRMQHGKYWNLSPLSRSEARGEGRG